MCRVTAVTESGLCACECVYVCVRAICRRLLLSGCDDALASIVIARGDDDRPYLVAMQQQQQQVSAEADRTFSKIGESRLVYRVKRKITNTNMYLYFNNESMTFESTKFLIAASRACDNGTLIRELLTVITGGRGFRVIDRVYVVVIGPTATLGSRGPLLHALPPTIMPPGGPV